MLATVLEDFGDCLPMLLQNSRDEQSDVTSRRPPDDLNADGNQNLRVTAVYDYPTPENVARPGAADRVDATSSIDFPVILIPEIATSINAAS